MERIRYGQLFEDNHNKDNFLHYDERDVVSTSMTYPHSDN